MGNFFFIRAQSSYLLWPLFTSFFCLILSPGCISYVKCYLFMYALQSALGAFFFYIQLVLLGNKRLRVINNVCGFLQGRISLDNIAQTQAPGHLFLESLNQLCPFRTPSSRAGRFLGGQLQASFLLPWFFLVFWWGLGLAVLAIFLFNFYLTEFSGKVPLLSLSCRAYLPLHNFYVSNLFSLWGGLVLPHTRFFILLEFRFAPSPPHSPFFRLFLLLS